MRHPRTGIGRSRFHDGFDDRDVTGAAAQVAGEDVANALLAGVRLIGQQRMHGREDAGSAKSALDGVMLAECGLQRRKLALAGEAFHCHDLGAFGLHSQRETRSHGQPVDNHRTRAADAVFAGYMRTSQPQRVAKRVGQRCPRFGVERPDLAIDASC